MDLRVSDDPVGAAARRIGWRLRDAIRRRGAASVALSGGSTAPPMIEQLLAQPVEWSAVTVFQVDERIAPDGHRARNLSQLTELARRTTVLAMPVTAGDVDDGAARYAALLPGRLDVVHLGLGDDGHTASWPPDRPDVARSSASVVTVGEFNGWRRMTMTRRAVNAARCRVVLALGPGKRPMVERWLDGDSDLPIAAVRQTGTQVHLDTAAAGRWAPN